MELKVKWHVWVQRLPNGKESKTKYNSLSEIKAQNMANSLSGWFAKKYGDGYTRVFIKPETDHQLPLFEED